MDSVGLWRTTESLKGTRFNDIYDWSISESVQSLVLIILEASDLSTPVTGT